MSIATGPNPVFGCVIFDDIFVIWTEGREELDEFINHLNSCHQTIKCTVKISATGFKI